MRVKEAMTKTVHTLQPGRPLGEAAAMMERFEIQHVVVVDHGKPVGVVSDGDLLRNANASTVDEAMTRKLVTIDGNELVAHAANLMRGHGIKCLVVTDGPKLAGIITSTDVLEIVGRSGHLERMILRDRGIRKRRA